MTTIAPTQSQIQQVLRSFLLSILPAGVEVIEGQDNRVGEPESTNFVVMTPLFKERLETNHIVYADVAFTGAISQTTLTVSNVIFGTIAIGSTLFGTGVSSSPTITKHLTGTTGGAGTYTISVAQNVAAELMAAGLVYYTQPTKTTVQLDIHSADVSTSSDMAATISTLFRSEVAVDFFASQGFAVSPLYADDPKQMPFLNSEQQYETRWTVDAVMQANELIPWHQQFAQSLYVTPVMADSPLNR